MTKALTTIEQDGRVFIKEGALRTNSRDVAKTFDKRHDNVVRAIKDLIAEGVLNFEETPYVNQQNGERYLSYDMDRDAFSVLCMGFTGSKAVRWKLDYVRAFNAMEAELGRDDQRSTEVVVSPHTPPVRIDLDDPRQLLELSVSLLAKTQELRNRAELAEVRLEAARPAVEFTARVEAAEGSHCLQDAGRFLKIGPNRGITLMSEKGLIFRPFPKAPWKAKARFVEKGWFDNRMVMSGTFTTMQTVITNAGIVGFASMIGRPITQLQLFNLIEAERRDSRYLTAA